MIPEMPISMVRSQHAYIHIYSHTNTIDSISTEYALSNQGDVSVISLIIMLWKAPGGKHMSDSGGTVRNNPRNCSATSTCRLTLSGGFSEKQGIIKTVKTTADFLYINPVDKGMI